MTWVRASIWSTKSWNDWLLASIWSWNDLSTREFLEYQKLKWLVLGGTGALTTFFYTKMKNVSCAYDRWVVGTQLCKLRDTTFVINFRYMVSIVVSKVFRALFNRAAWGETNKKRRKFKSSCPVVFDTTGRRVAEKNSVCTRTIYCCTGGSAGCTFWLLSYLGRSFPSKLVIAASSSTPVMFAPVRPRYRCPVQPYTWELSVSARHHTTRMLLRAYFPRGWFCCKRCCCSVRRQNEQNWLFHPPISARIFSRFWLVLVIVIGRRHDFPGPTT